MTVPTGNCNYLENGSTVFTTVWRQRKTVDDRDSPRPPPYLTRKCLLVQTLADCVEYLFSLAFSIQHSSPDVHSSFGDRWLTSQDLPDPFTSTQVLVYPRVVCSRGPESAHVDGAYDRACMLSSWLSSIWQFTNASSIISFYFLLLAHLWLLFPQRIHTLLNFH